MTVDGLKAGDVTGCRELKLSWYVMLGWPKFTPLSIITDYTCRKDTTPQHSRHSMMAPTRNKNKRHFFIIVCLVKLEAIRMRASVLMQAKPGQRITAVSLPDRASLTLMVTSLSNQAPRKTNLYTQPSI
jgi:hypothetical protein